MDKQLLYNQFIVAEIENDWNSENTKKSMKVKSNHLKKWAEMEGLINIGHGGCKTFNKMIIKDPRDSPFKTVLNNFQFVSKSYSS